MLTDTYGYRVSTTRRDTQLAEWFPYSRYPPLRVVLVPDSLDRGREMLIQRCSLPMITFRFVNQWQTQPDSVSILCFDLAIEKEFLGIVVGCMGFLLWVGAGLGEPIEDEEF